MEVIERRVGKTGIWTFVLRTEDGKIIARSEWGTNYEFNEKEWFELPILTSATSETKLTKMIYG